MCFPKPSLKSMQSSGLPSSQDGLAESAALHSMWAAAPGDPSAGGDETSDLGSNARLLAGGAIKLTELVEAAARGSDAATAARDRLLREADRIKELSKAASSSGDPADAPYALSLFIQALG